MGAVHQPWQAIGLDFDGHHHIQAQNRQVVEVIPVQGLCAQMGMDTAQPLEATDALTDPLQWRDLKASGIAYQNRFDAAMATDQQPNLTFDFTRELGKIARQLLGDDAFRRETTAIQMFEATQLARL
jgi:hypothetical protein